MIFSNSCQYAIKSCIYLAVKQDKIDVTEISEFINSPVSFTSKILQKLAKSNIISSAKGRGGGFYLDNLQYQTTTIKDICEIFDNEGTLKGCILGLSKCNKKNPCPIHHYALEIRDKIKYILSLKICDVKDVGNRAIGKFADETLKTILKFIENYANFCTTLLSDYLRVNSVGKVIFLFWLGDDVFLILGISETCSDFGESLDLPFFLSKIC